MSLPPIPTISPKQIEHNNHSDAAGGQTGPLADEILALRPGEAMSTPLDTVHPDMVSVRPKRLAPKPDANPSDIRPGT
jgi:hypothetical protein